MLAYDFAFSRTLIKIFNKYAGGNLSFTLVKYFSYLVIIPLTNSFWLLSSKHFLISITCMQFALVHQMVYKVQV